MLFDLELEMIGKQRVNLVDELKVYIGPRLKNFVKIYAVKLFNLCKWKKLCHTIFYFKAD